MFEINYGMLIAQVINFGILYRLFKKYAAQPLLAMIE
jgi:F0F1-type ATP synthase membrane subunit b/b'